MRKMLAIFVALMTVTQATYLWTVGNDGVILYSNDDANSWTTQTSGVSTTLRSIAARTSVVVWAVGDSGVLLSTGNGGTTWTTIDLGITTNLYGVYFRTFDTGWVLGGASNVGFVSYTIDAGVTWTNVNPSSNILRDAFFLDFDIGIAVGNSGNIRRSINGGASWASVTSPTTNQLNSVSFTNANTGSVIGIIVGNGGVMLRSTDNGASWSSITSPTSSNLYDFSFLGSSTYGYTVLTNAIVKTTDSGSSWSEIAVSVQAVYLGARFVNQNAHWLCGESGTVTRTLDAGVTWDQTTTSITSTLLSITSFGGPLTTKSPTVAVPTATPTGSPTAAPTKVPTSSPTAAPTGNPTAAPTKVPTSSPTAAPTKSPTAAPTKTPTSSPTSAPTKSPTAAPTKTPTSSPTAAPTKSPTNAPTKSPTGEPTTGSPTDAPTTGPPTDAPVTCFHEETIFRYNDAMYNVYKIPLDCHIPHKVRSDGIKIYTTCSKSPLRVTHDHLIYTKSGLRAASTLQHQDMLYSDLKETQPCFISQITNETNQLYFGLNCKESVILANNLKVSTFGKYHLIPSWWMKYVSGIIGIKRGSMIGDSIATWFFGTINFATQIVEIVRNNSKFMKYV
jgi:photosystem II stability/assembly factor-like uncharacterized protein